MDKELLLNREKEIYEKYQNIVTPYIMELEVRDSEYPIEIMNEIRAIFTHLSRYKLQMSEKDLSSAENHMKRAILDCYKYLCISISEEIYNFRERYRKVDLKIADNGCFLPELDRLESIAKETFIKAKKSEIQKLDEDNQYELYEKAYISYCNIEKHLENSHNAILFASSHSKKSNFINIIACIFTVISIIVTIVAIV
ncbi:MAG: hypothetical protein SPL51_08140 [Lachnospiraceae bacterium]|nr:hypothetical protein [Lachnospiraceae bacterium]